VEHFLTIALFNPYVKLFHAIKANINNNINTRGTLKNLPVIEKPWNIFKVTKGDFLVGDIR
jgi:hypothetical protein